MSREGALTPPEEIPNHNPAGVNPNQLNAALNQAYQPPANQPQPPANQPQRADANGELRILKPHISLACKISREAFCAIPITAIISLGFVLTGAGTAKSALLTGSLTGALSSPPNAALDHYLHYSTTPGQEKGCKVAIGGLLGAFSSVAMSHLAGSQPSPKEVTASAAAGALTGYLSAIATNSAPGRPGTGNKGR